MKKNRILALFLCIVAVLSLLPSLINQNTLALQMNIIHMEIHELVPGIIHMTLYLTI
jgi:hypothetical protein